MENYDFGHVSNEAFAAMALAAVLGVILPLIAALIWCKVKKERFTTVLIGAATFMLFAIVLEKSLQSLVIGIDHPVSRFLYATPVLYALVIAIFPGVFEETGRYVAFKTVLRRRKNRETAISHGIGHGGFEAMFILGLTFAEYIVYGVMINNGTYGAMADALLASSPATPGLEQQFFTVAEQITSVTLGNIWVSLLERVFAILFHTGASMLVFYACKDPKKKWLYPLAIVLHTLIDFVVAGLLYVGLVNYPVWLTETMIGVSGIGLFLAAFFLLYRKDKPQVSGVSSETV